MRLVCVPGHVSTCFGVHNSFCQNYELGHYGSAVTNYVCVLMYVYSSNCIALSNICDRTALVHVLIILW